MNACLIVRSHRLFAGILAAVCCLQASEAKPHEPDKAEKPAADSMLGKKAGEVRDDNCLTMKLIWCTPGFVTMEQVEQIEQPVKDEEELDEDNPDDGAGPRTRMTEKVTPVRVRVTRGFWLGKYEIMQVQWKQLMGTEPWRDRRIWNDGDDFAASYINWDDAIAFCQKLTKMEREAGRLPPGWEYTLPTEAQWERACRARTDTLFSFGNDQSKLGDYAWFRINAWDAGEKYPHRVGQKRPNPWGFYDMYGNSFEWCRDFYQPTLPGGSDPEVTAKGSGRVIRGGCWSNIASECRFRWSNSPDDRDYYLGFRVALAGTRLAKPAGPNSGSPGADDK